MEAKKREMRVAIARDIGELKFWLTAALQKRECGKPEWKQNHDGSYTVVWEDDAWE